MQDERETLDIENEQRALKVFYESYKITAIPERLFRFLKEKVEEKVK